MNVAASWHDLRAIPHYLSELVSLDRRIVQPGDRYEWELGRLGMWLDAASAFEVTVMDMGHGFVTRYHRPDMEPVFVERFFLDEEVAVLRPGDLRLRRRMRGKAENRFRGIATERGGYRDLFRALGHELDRRAVSSCVIREEGDDLLLIVCNERGEEQERWLGPSDRVALRAAARSRRTRRKRWKG